MMQDRYFYRTTAIFSALGLLILLLTGCSWLTPTPTLEAPYTQVQKAGVSHIPVGMGRLYVFRKKKFIGGADTMGLKLNGAALLGRLNNSDYLYTDLRPGYYSLGTLIGNEGIGERESWAENVLVRKGRGVFIELAYVTITQIPEFKAKQNISDYRLVVSEDSSGIRPMTQAAAMELSKARNEAVAKRHAEEWAEYRAKRAEDSDPFPFDYGSDSGSGSGSGGIDFGKMYRQLERDRFNRNYSRNPDHAPVGW